MAGSPAWSPAERLSGRGAVVTLGGCGFTTHSPEPLRFGCREGQTLPSGSPGFAVELEIAAGDVVVRFGRSFTASDAAGVTQALSSFPPASQVTLDFTGVHEFDPVGILPLAAWLERAQGVRIVLRGLTLHEARMLAYFGIRPTPLGPTRSETEKDRRGSKA